MQKLQSPLSPRCYVLCERSTGAVRFQVEADPDGSLPVEKIAGLLAVHCLVRGQAPEDYELMIVPRERLLDPAAERAQQLLAAGRALGTGVRISRREQEVLDGILQNLANKEIAARLHVSERTVKFHVSSLLAKFGVTDRVALSREATLNRMPGQFTPGSIPAYSSSGVSSPVEQPLPEGEERALSRAEMDAISNPQREVQRTGSGLLPMIARQRRYAT